MKKILLFIYVLMQFGIVVSQDTKNYIAELIPPSPTVAELGKYGDVPVGKYTGSVNTNIPIHQISFQEITIPISASYNTGGIRVSQEATWIGLGWNLTANAVISRTVKSYDDLGNTGATLGYIYSNVYNYPLSKAQQDELVAAYNNTPIDIEPDIFNVTIFGQSIRFILPKKGNNRYLTATVLNDANTLVYLDTNDMTFEVVNNLGYHFYFNSKEYTTLYRSGTGGAGGITDEENALALISYQTNDGSRTRQVTSAWHLDRIQAPNGEELFFDYQPGFHFGYPSFEDSREINPCDGPDKDIINSPGLRSVSGYITGFESLYLERISGSFGSVEFVLEDRDDISSNYQTPSTFPLAINVDLNEKPQRLATIKIKNYNGGEVKRAVFNYSYFNDDKNQNTEDYKKEKYIRLKLDGITIQDREYEFEYISPNALPAKDSRAEDFWGFYNGKDNAGRIPSFGRMVWCSIYNKNTFINYEGADRSSNHNFGKIGQLSKITYPTKGFTEFEYESHKAVVEKPTVDQNDPFSNSTDFSYNYQYLKRPLVNSLWKAVTTGETFTINNSNLPFANNIEVSTKMSCEGYCSQSPDSSQFVFTIENINDPTKTYPLIRYIKPNGNDTGIRTMTTNLPNGTYRIIHNPYSWTNGYAIISARERVSFYINVPSESSLPFEEFEVGGSRVKSITNKDHNGSFISKKSYDYSQTQFSQSVSSGILMDQLIYHSKGGIYDYSPQEFSSKFIISSNSPLSLNPSAQGNHIGYSFVTETQQTINGETKGIIRSNFYNRKNESLTYFFGVVAEQAPEMQEISQTYRDVTYGNAYLLGVQPIYFDYKNGSLFSEEVIDREGATKTFTSYPNYEDITYNTKNVVRAHLSKANVIHHYNYQQKGQLHLLAEKEQIEYFDSARSISTTERYTYNERYLSESSEMTTSEDDKTVNSYTYYPFSTAHGVSGQPHMQDLINNNRLAIPVMKQSFENAKLISEQLTIFDEFSSTNMILPKVIKDRKGNNTLEDRFEFHLYDERNNPLETSLIYGSKTSYIWGYNKMYPIAKIENASYTQIASALGLSGITAVKSLDERDLTAINSLRNHTSFNNKMITTYTYNPLIGITSMTDPKGYTMYYHYDEFNRLEFVKDADGNLVSENKYNYKN